MCWPRSSPMPIPPGNGRRRVGGAALPWLWRERVIPLDAEQATDAEVSGDESEVESDGSDGTSVLCPTCGRPMRRRTLPPGGVDPRGWTP